MLDSAAARRLAPDRWAETEAQLAARVGEYTPAQLSDWGTRLVELLDQDGPEPDDTPPLVNEVHLRRHRDRAGGTISGRFDDAAMFDAIATAVDAHARPRCAEDGERPTPERQAEALAKICGFVLDHGDLPRTGGRRPHVNVTVRLEDLENRARAACPDFGGTLTPESLRMLCCDAAVIPIVMGGAGQPLDIGRRRTCVVARDRLEGRARSRGDQRVVRPSAPAR